MPAVMEKPRKKPHTSRLTVKDVDNFFRPALKGEVDTREFLEKLGMTIKPDGTVVVRPL